MSSSELIESYRRKHEESSQRLTWFVVASLLLHALALLLGLFFRTLIPQPESQELIEFVLVDPEDIEPPETDLQANVNSVDGGEQTPDTPSEASEAPAQAQDQSDSDPQSAPPPQEVAAVNPPPAPAPVPAPTPTTTPKPQNHPHPTATTHPTPGSHPTPASDPRSGSDPRPCPPTDT